MGRGRVTGGNLVQEAPAAVQVHRRAVEELGAALARHFQGAIHLAPRVAGPNRADGPLAPQTPHPAGDRLQAVAHFIGDPQAYRLTDRQRQRGQGHGQGFAKGHGGPGVLFLMARPGHFQARGRFLPIFAFDR